MACSSPPLPALPDWAGTQPPGTGAGKTKMANPGKNWRPPRSPLGRMHISTYCRQEAEKEYDAWLNREPFCFRTPEINGQGYLLTDVEIGTRNLERLVELYRE